MVSGYVGSVKKVYEFRYCSAATTLTNSGSPGQLLVVVYTLAALDHGLVRLADHLHRALALAVEAEREPVALVVDRAAHRHRVWHDVDDLVDHQEEVAIVRARHLVGLDMSVIDRAMDVIKVLLARGLGAIDPERPDQAKALDRKTDDARARAQLLDRFRGQTRYDLDSINELTRLLEPPSWTNNTEITRDSFRIMGQAPAAAPLVTLLESSPFFEGVTLLLAQPAQSGETFQIQGKREARK